MEKLNNLPNDIDASHWMEILSEWRNYNKARG